MRINNVSQNINIRNISKNKNLNVQNQNFGQVSSSSSTVSNVSLISQVNSDLPVSYAKIAEIPIPGLKDKASLYKLSNGQKVVIAPKKGPTFVATSFNVGSFNEPDNLRGISHYIEHSLFNGSKNLEPKEYDKKITALGGYTNAFTNYGETRYHLNLQLLQDKSLEEAIRLNALQTQFPTFSNEQLEREKEPVKSEIDMYKDDFFGIAYSTMLKNMFSINSTSDDLVIGTKNNINSFNRDIVFDYFNTWYTPDNAITAITGDIDPEETIKLVSKYYNKQLDTSKHSQRMYMDLNPVNKPMRQDFKQKNDPNALIVMGFPVPANISNRELDKLDVMLGVLASKNSKLSQLLDEYGISFNFLMEQLSSDISASKVISATASLPEEKVEQVLKLIYQGITDLQNNPPSQEELKRIVDAKINNMNNISEYSESVNSSLIQIVRQNDLNYFEDYKNTISNVTPQDISSLASKFLDLNKTSICVAHPEIASDEQIIDRHKVVHGSKSVSFGKSVNIQQSLVDDASKVKQYKLPNNIQLMVSSVENIADSSLNIAFESTNLNNDIYLSHAYVLEELLNRGSIYKNDRVYEDELLNNSSSVKFIVDDKGIFVSSSIPANNINNVLPLIKESLLAPNFTQEEFDRAKSVIKDDLMAHKKSPHSKLNQQLMPNSKYYLPIEEQIAALDKMTLTDCVNLYNKLFYNSQVAASYAGQVDTNPNLQGDLINNLSGNFPTFSQFKPAISYSTNLYKPNNQELILTDVEENAQASIVQSYQYKASGNIEDITKVDLLNHILGAGGMSSRLFKDLRLEQDLAYRVRSDAVRQNDIGIINLFIMTSTDPVLTDEATPENINKSLNGFKNNIEKLKTELVTQEELDSMKNRLKSEILNSLEGNYSKSINMYSNASSFYGGNYVIEYINALDKITPEDIRTTANFVFANQPITSIVASERTLNSLNLK